MLALSWSTPLAMWTHAATPADLWSHAASAPFFGPDAAFIGDKEPKHSHWITDTMSTAEIILKSEQIRECLNRADTLGHDTVMVRVQCPFISATIAKSEPTIKIVLSLFSGDELLGERLVTTSYRQHQFLLPISLALGRFPMIIKTKVVEFAECEAEPNFDIQFESASGAS